MLLGLFILRKTTKGKWCVEFRKDGFSFSFKEVFILLLRHLGSAGVGLDLKATCILTK